MKYSSDKIKTVGFFGQHGSGKTQLAEALLYKAGVTDRLGRPDQGTSILDFAKEEQDRKATLNLKVGYLEHDGVLLNLIDTPGFMDFWGDIASATRAIELGVIVVDATAGVGPVTEKAYTALTERKIPILFFINKIKSEKANLQNVFDELKNTFDKEIIYLTSPDDAKWILDSDSEFKEKLIEAIAETEDELTEKYLEGEEFTTEEIQKGLQNLLKQGKVLPLMFGDALSDFGIDEFLKRLIELTPNVQSDSDKVVAFCFKSTADPHVGQIRFVKVLSGTIKQGDTLWNANEQADEKINQIFMVCGKNRQEVPEIVAGQIGALVKLKVTKTNHTICSKDGIEPLEPIKFPEPQEKTAIIPKTRKDEEKVMEGLTRLQEEDPSFKFYFDTESQQTIIVTMGDMHLDVILSKLKARFGVDITTQRPKIHYRETFKRTTSAEGKYKRQTGGRGQYGHTIIRFEPLPRGSGFEFTDTIKGGIIPARFIPAVEKGLREAMKKGPLAGYPTTDIKATLYDGSFHEVDSSDIAFQIAAAMAFRKAAETADPTLLEPIMEVEVVVPEEVMGDVMGDLNSRRGKILNTERIGRYCKIKAHVPEAELYKYSATLNSLTGGRGTYTAKFSHYDEVPKEIQKKIIEERQREKEESK